MKSEISGKTARSIQVTTVEVHSSKKPDDIVFRCKLCNKRYRLAKDFAGIEAECAKCKKTLVVPRHSDLSDENLQDKIIFRCHECSQKYRLPRIYANQKAKCSRCHSFFIIPEQSDIAQPVPPRAKAQETQKWETPGTSGTSDKQNFNSTGYCRLLCWSLVIFSEMVLAFTV